MHSRRAFTTPRPRRIRQAPIPVAAIQSSSRRSLHVQPAKVEQPLFGRTYAILPNELTVANELVSVGLNILSTAQS